MDVFAPIREDAPFSELLRLLRAGPGPVAAEGLWGSSAPVLAALAAEALRRPLLLITAHADEADDLRDDVETAIGATPELLPQLETHTGQGAAADEELTGERLRLCLLMAEARRGQGEPVRIVAPIMALMQPVPSPEALEARSFKLAVGAEHEPEVVANWLTEHGFRACDAVEVAGDFARRGGILDVYSSAHMNPVRIEFFGNEVDSIRLFDPGTQRSSQPLDEICLPALSFTKAEAAVGKTTTSFMALLPPDTLIALQEPSEIQELGRTYLQRLGERAGIIPAEAVLRAANAFTGLHLHRFQGGAAPAVQFDVASLPQFEARSAEAFQTLRGLSDECDVIVLCENAPEAQRFEELLSQERGTPAVPAEAPGVGAEAASPLATPPGALDRVRAAIGVVHRGFLWGRTAYVPHHELFHRFRQRRTLRRVAPARPIDSFFDLAAGDHVVHVLHGIGRFLGLKSLQKEGQTGEYLAIEFADEAVVHVPVSQIYLIQKYIGTFRGRPRLSKIGGSTWKRTKERVAEAVTDMAAELLAIQARRAMEAGVAYPRDTGWQREFDGAFPYTETPDQLRAIEEIKHDLTRPRPMDRLLCGDVGYGKTEVAMRAAFKVVEYGRQVAVLVPTTVLAEQHYQTFRDRMADYPFAVEVLSRFRSKGEQRQIVERARQGQVDILIGTHRLLSADVRFADLGLVIIDEEQRFGVEAKERLKQLRATVELLTLTATPIPRTLHMSLLGIRDISSLATAPVDRRAIVTQVRMWDDGLIRAAILRELDRDGQVYFVHNFVRDIHMVANRLRTLVPEARFVVGHGQMAGGELEEVMLAFLRREADVLVSTNIIESGLDIPSANTIFVNRGERFGLAELHQLRGRVGRSRHRAYCYCLLSPKHPVHDTAARRLKALEHYSDLGAGFQIAMRDLEIRGAGNILGSEQSGHIEAVGYEMYCQLLEQSVRKLKNEPPRDYRPVNLDLGISATIPRAYIRSDRQRMEVYKRITQCRTLAEIEVLRSDLRDAFGPLPEAVETLLRLGEIRALAGQWGVRSIVLDPPDLIFSIDDLQKVQPLFSEGPGSPRMPDPQTIHWRLPKRLLEGNALLETLRAQLQERPVLVR
ncbi:MAG: transcription-repair coupling factor [Phycisphaerales bacterium]|nr:transcription-repair coupling factor [Phycisphaerales bacterium]